MWLGYIVGVLLLLAGAGLIYVVLKSMGRDGIEAAAPGSCRSGRCGVTPSDNPPTEATPIAHVSADELTRMDGHQPPR